MDHLLRRLTMSAGLALAGPSSVAPVAPAGLAVAIPTRPVPAEVVPA